MEDQQGTVAGIKTSLVSQERKLREGRIAEEHSYSSSDENGSNERGAHNGCRREKHAIPNIIIEFLVHHLCNGREENPAKRSLLVQAIFQSIKKIHPNFFCLLSDGRRSFKSHPNLVQIFENIITLTQSQIRVSDLPAYNPSLSLDLVRFHQLVQPDIIDRDDRFSKEFQVHSMLGKGGFGVVMKAENKLDRSLYAIKIISLRSQKADFNRVLREAQSLAKLQHRGIVKYNSAWIQLYNFYNLSEWRRSEDFKDDYEYSTSLSVSSPGCQSSVSSHRLPVITEVTGDNTTSSEYVVFQDDKPSDINNLRKQMKSIEVRGVDDGDDDKESSKSSKHGQELVHQKYWNYEQKSHSTSTIPKGILTLNLCLFIQMELCGDSLYKWIQSRNETCENGNRFSVIDLRRNRNILLELFEAVGYMHSKNVIHRDLKPANIMFDLENEHIKLGDFGLSRHLIDPAESMGENNCLTPITDYWPQTAGVGTKVYIAPERCSGTSYDAKSDIYSLGIITLELYQPFSTDSEKYHHISALKQRKPLEKMGSHFIHAYLLKNLPQVVSLITRLTESLPKNRPSAEEVLYSLKYLPGSIEITNSAQYYNDCSAKPPDGGKAEYGSGRGASDIHDTNSTNESHFAQDADEIQDSDIAHDLNRSNQNYSSYSAEMYCASMKKIKDLQSENTVLKEENSSLKEENVRMYKEIESLKRELFHFRSFKENMCN